jgi:hypothetical protein
VTKVKHRATVLGFGLAATLLTAGGPLRAYPEYPELIQTHFRQCAVTCLLCHTSSEGGVETIRRGRDTTALPPERGAGTFVVNLIEVSLSQDPMVKITARTTTPTAAELIAALETLKERPCSLATQLPCDSDGDGASDYAELVAGSDPERPGTDSHCPKYGCGASHVAKLAPNSVFDVSLVCSAVALALLFVRRRG